MGANRMFVLPGGTCRLPMSRIRRGGSEDEYRTIPVPNFLIDTDDGWVLFDTGCDPRVREDPEGVWGRLAQVFQPEVGEEDHIVRRLESVGVAPTEVAHVVISHLHMDHAGGIRFFPATPVYLQKAEYRWAMHPDRVGAGGYLHSDFDHDTVRYELLEGDAQIVPGVHVLLTDGHTPGHQSLVVDLPSGRFVITGDCAYELGQVLKGIPPPTATDEFAAVRSLARVRAFIERDGATVIVNHDADGWEALRVAPEDVYR